MSVFDELDCMIEYYTRYNRETGENESEYNNMKEEIDSHLCGETPFDSLSPDAKKIMTDWESFVSDMEAFESEGRIGPLDV